MHSFNGFRVGAPSALVAGLTLFAALGMGTQVFAQRAVAATGPLASLAGAWRGEGAVTRSDGGRERIRCRASYRVTGDGASMRQTLDCASDSYRFSLAGDVRVQSGGDISGSWRESSRNVNGSITGRARDGQINGMIQGAGFAALISVRTTGDRQQVSLSTEGNVRNVSINLRRSR